ncbi:MAG: glycosyltransferase family 4 protein [Pseudomonadota bacterium]|nr:glycosyltransferase family 4 protein [Pseudomonadota bacterium]
MASLSPAEIEVIAPNLGRRYSGITSTIERVVPRQSRSLPIATMGQTVSSDLPRIGFGELWKFWRAPKRVPFRVWHARRNDDLVLGLFLRSVLRMPLKLVFTSAAQRKHTKLTKFLIRHTDAIIATSPESASYLSRPCTIIRHGMDTDQFRPCEDKPALRKQIGLPDMLLMGCFGRVRPDKGTDIFVDAFINIASHHPDVAAVVTGLTKSQYADFRAEMIRKVKAGGLADRLLWLGERDASEMMDLYRALDIYVAPQRWEGFGVTPIEAMSSGVPVVATTVGTFKSQVVEGKTGYLVPPGNVEAITAAIRRLVDDPELRRKMGAAGRAHVVENFDVQDEADAINAVYRELWARAGTPDAIEPASGKDGA